MVANSASRLCCVTVPVPLLEDIDVRELTELFGACDAKRAVGEDKDGLLPCVGVAGAVAVVLEVYEDPKSLRVDENRRDGNRLDDEY